MIAARPRHKSTSEGITVASRTYVKANKLTAKAAGVKPVLTGSPEDDFGDILRQVISKDRVLNMYAMGLKRGLTKARTGKLKPNKRGQIIIRVKIKFRGENWQSKSFSFAAKDLGWL
jgi:hypothetical protein